MISRRNDRSESRACLHDQRGSTLLETALTLPFLFTLLFGVIQFGLILAARINIQDASAIGARNEALYGGGGLDAVVKSSLSAWIDPLDVTVTPTPVCVGVCPVGAPTNATRVQVSYNMPLLIPFVVPSSVGGRLVINAETTMR